VYYYCRTKQLAEHACVKRSIRLDELENTVLSAIQLQIKLVDDLAQTIDKINAAPKVNNQSNRLLALLKHHEEELARTKKISDSLYVDWKSGDITREEYLRMKAEFTNKLEQIEQAIDKIQDDCNVIATGITSESTYFKEFQKYRNIKSLKRDILVSLVDKIIVHEGGEIRIRFNFTDQYQRILDFIENNERELVIVGNSQTA